MWSFLRFSVFIINSNKKKRKLYNWQPNVFKNWRKKNTCIEGQTFTWSCPAWPFNDIWGGFIPECSLTLKVWWPRIANDDDSAITGRAFSDKRWHHVSSVLDSLFASIALVWLEANLWLWWNHFVQSSSFFPIEVISNQCQQINCWCMTEVK